MDSPYYEPRPSSYGASRRASTESSSSLFSKFKTMFTTHRSMSTASLSSSPNPISSPPTSNRRLARISKVQLAHLAFLLVLQLEKRQNVYAAISDEIPITKAMSRFVVKKKLIEHVQTEENDEGQVFERLSDQELLDFVKEVEIEGRLRTLRTSKARQVLENVKALEDGGLSQKHHRSARRTASQPALSRQYASGSVSDVRPASQMSTFSQMHRPLSTSTSHANLKSKTLENATEYAAPSRAFSQQQRSRGNSVSTLSATSTFQSHYPNVKAIENNIEQDSKYRQSVDIRRELLPEKNSPADVFETPQRQSQVLAAKEKKTQQMYNVVTSSSSSLDLKRIAAANSAASVLSRTPTVIENTTPMASGEGGDSPKKLPSPVESFQPIVQDRIVPIMSSKDTGKEIITQPAPATLSKSPTKPSSVRSPNKPSAASRVLREVSNMDFSSRQPVSRYDYRSPVSSEHSPLDAENSIQSPSPTIAPSSNQNVKHVSTSSQGSSQRHVLAKPRVTIVRKPVPSLEQLLESEKKKISPPAVSQELPEAHKNTTSPATNEQPTIGRNMPSSDNDLQLATDATIRLARKVTMLIHSQNSQSGSIALVTRDDNGLSPNVQQQQDDLLSVPQSISHTQARTSPPMLSSSPIAQLLDDLEDESIVPSDAEASRTDKLDAPARFHFSERPTSPVSPDLEHEVSPSPPASDDEDNISIEQTRVKLMTKVTRNRKFSFEFGDDSNSVNISREAVPLVVSTAAGKEGPVLLEVSPTKLKRISQLESIPEDPNEEKLFDPTEWASELLKESTIEASEVPDVVSSLSPELEPLLHLPSQENDKWEIVDPFPQQNASLNVLRSDTVSRSQASVAVISRLEKDEQARKRLELSFFSQNGPSSEVIQGSDSYKSKTSMVSSLPASQPSQKLRITTQIRPTSNAAVHRPARSSPLTASPLTAAASLPGDKSSPSSGAQSQDSSIEMKIGNTSSESLRPSVRERLREDRHSLNGSLPQNLALVEEQMRGDTSVRYLQENSSHTPTQLADQPSVVPLKQTESTDPSWRRKRLLRSLVDSDIRQLRKDCLEEEQERNELMYEDGDEKTYNLVGRIGYSPQQVQISLMSMAELRTVIKEVHEECERRWGPPRSSKLDKLL